jgi:beta-barrel assembly-enhancing protease
MRYGVAFLAFMAGCTAALPALAVAPKAETVAAYKAISALDARLASVGYQLATANAPYCADNTGFNPGWVLHDIAQYPDSTAAKAAFGFSQPVEIAFVVPGGEADNQGVKPGDGLMRVGNRDVAGFAGAGTERLDALRLFLDQLWGPNYLAPIRVQRDGAPREILFQLNPVCKSHFWIEASSKRDAGADGEQVRVTSALAEYARDDAELAAIAAHELAHNLLGHPQRLRAAKKAKRDLVVAAELDADRLSVWLLTNAGYDPRAAVRFWQRCGPASCLGPLRYPAWKKRVEIINTEIAQLEKTLPNSGRRAPPLLATVQKTQ